MMHVDIEIKYPRINFEQLQDADYDIIYIAEPTSLRFLCVMIASSPIDSDI